MQILNIK